jgi:hypothetical protein
MRTPTPTLLTLSVLSLAFAALPALAEYCPSRNPPTAYIYPGTNANLRGPVHPVAVNQLKCVVEKLRAQGLPIKTLWGYGCRPASYSLHPRGLAVDVDQYARDRTSPQVPRQAGVQIANSCNVVSGAIWRNPDNGHFEVHSLSRQQQAQRAPAASPQRRPRPVATRQPPRRNTSNTWLFW